MNSSILARLVAAALAVAMVTIASAPALAATSTYTDPQGYTQNAAGTQSIGAANFATAQISVAATATLIVAARSSGRMTVTITNTTTTPIYLGPTSGVTTSSGALLQGAVGAQITLPYTGAVYGIVATGAATVTEHEIY